MSLKGSFYTDTMRDFSNRECRVNTAISLGNNNAFIGLQPLSRTFADFNLNNQVITGAKFGNVMLELSVLDVCDQFILHQVNPQFAAIG